MVKSLARWLKMLLVNVKSLKILIFRKDQGRIIDMHVINTKKKRREEAACMQLEYCRWDMVVKSLQLVD